MSQGSAGVAETLRKNIETGRKARGLTQTQLGDRVGRCWRTIHRWEAGSTVPSLEMILSLAQALHVRPERLQYEPTSDFKASFVVKEED